MANQWEELSKEDAKLTRLLKKARRLLKAGKVAESTAVMRQVNEIMSGQPKARS